MSGKYCCMRLMYKSCYKSRYAQKLIMFMMHLKKETAKITQSFTVTPLFERQYLSCKDADE